MHVAPFLWFRNLTIKTSVCPGWRPRKSICKKFAPVLETTPKLYVTFPLHRDLKEGVSDRFITLVSLVTVMVPHSLSRITLTPFRTVSNPLSGSFPTIVEGVFTRTTVTGGFTVLLRLIHRSGKDETSEPFKSSNFLNFQKGFTK